MTAFARGHPIKSPLLPPPPLRFRPHQTSTGKILPRANKKSRLLPSVYESHVLNQLAGTSSEEVLRALLSLSHQSVTDSLVTNDINVTLRTPAFERR
ncbi:hypothetical protein BaRGS_00026777 [Batillaria attramentaria]|uniref:Uncharacterized protein n=1 Tax=Batillaria attramentaria TaxID=370345 RepID=A0ABD0K3Z8_9CAEN